jgi:hypothetical protein
MPITFSRKNFLKTFVVAGSAAIVQPQLFAQTKARPPALHAVIVKEFVGKSHSDLNCVKELLTTEPGLLNCAWDWGGGDFETGLEAAGHVGRKDIAMFLLENGARMNIFCAAMLGKLDVVKSVLTSFPLLKDSKGPHGLKLIHHATKGGEDAREVLEFLKSINAS